MITLLSLWGLYEQQTNHFRFPKFISTKLHAAGKVSTERSLTGISCLTLNRISPPWMFLSILKGSQKPLIRNWPFGKLLSIFVSEIISKSTLLARSFARNSNLFLIELMLRCAKISLFKMLLRSDFKWLVSVEIFLLLDLHPAKLLLLPVTSPLVLHKTHCHWNIFDIARTDVVDIMLVALLVRCNFDLFKCWCFMFLLWSIRLMFLSLHISFRWLFTSWALCWCLSLAIAFLVA